MSSAPPYITAAVLLVLSQDGHAKHPFDCCVEADCDTSLEQSLKTSGGRRCNDKRMRLDATAASCTCIGGTNGPMCQCDPGMEYSVVEQGCVSKFNLDLFNRGARLALGGHDLISTSGTRPATIPARTIHCSTPNVAGPAAASMSATHMCTCSLIALQGVGRCPKSHMRNHVPISVQLAAAVCS